MSMLRLYKIYEEKTKYLIVGFWNTIFGYASFSALYYAMHKTSHYLVVLTISYIISITNAYLCYKIFVFKTKGNIIKEYLRFYVVYGVGYVINIITLPIMIEVLGITPYISQGIVTVFIVTISYLGHKHFSFGQRPSIHDLNK